MSIYTNIKPFSPMHGKDGPEIMKEGTTFKLLCYDQWGVKLETKSKEIVTVNLDVFNLVFKEVEL